MAGVGVELAAEQPQAGGISPGRRPHIAAKDADLFTVWGVGRQTTLLGRATGAALMMGKE